MNKLHLLQLAIAALALLAISIVIWRQQVEIKSLEKCCQDREQEAEGFSQDCERMAKLLKMACQERDDWRVLHSTVVAERNLAHREIPMLRSQLQLSEKARTQLTIQNRQMREALEISDVARWPLIAAIPSHKPEVN